MAEAGNNEHNEIEGAYIAVTEEIKLIPRPFEGNPRLLREFIEGVDSALEVTHQTKHELILKICNC